MVKTYITGQDTYTDWDGAFIQYKVDANNSYICKSAVGTSINSTGWSIFHLYDDASIRRITWPQDTAGIATSAPIFIASSYAGYTYS